MLAALEPQLGVVEQQLVAGATRRAVQLEHDPAAALRRLERELQRRAVRRGRASIRSIFASFFARDCAWRARVPARKRVTNRSSRSISACWRSIARPSASSRAAFSLRHACQVPAKNLPPAGLELQHRGADRLQKPAVVRDQHDRRVERRPGAARATRASRCRGGWSARRAAAGRGRRRARARARPASARRRRTCRASGRGRRRRGNPSPCSVASARSRQRVAAGVLEPRLRLRVAVERRLVVGAARPSPAPAPPARCSIATSSGAPEST